MKVVRATHNTLISITDTLLLYFKYSVLTLLCIIVQRFHHEFG